MQIRTLNHHGMTDWLAGWLCLGWAGAEVGLQVLQL
jgi:hypothetical protein